MGFWSGPTFPALPWAGSRTNGVAFNTAVDNPEANVEADIKAGDQKTLEREGH